jgi:hypothetical protein
MLAHLKFKQKITLHRSLNTINLLVQLFHAFQRLFLQYTINYKKNIYVEIFSGQYLDHYNAKPGATFPTDADNVILAVPTPNLCAKECTVTGSCKSFDYCADSKTCRLKNTHELDAPTAVFEKTPNCNHYSSK